MSSLLKLSFAAIALTSTLLLGNSFADDPAPTLSVQVDKPGAKISPTMWGVFFEDINFGADGGVYAELVKNRSFEFPNAMTGWSASITGGNAAFVEVHDDAPVSAGNPHYLRFKVYNDCKDSTLSNEGFRGIGVRKDDDYSFSVMARAVEGKPNIRVELVSADGKKSLGEAKVEVTSKEWKKYTAVVHASATELKGKLNLRIGGNGVAVDLDMVSLFPAKTWKDRPAGLRADMVQKLDDLKPGFVRFPGGCIVEGRWLCERYQWKNTIGDVSERKLLINRWNNEFRHRATPDYFQSFGLGFFEYFQMCEDIGAEPLPILNCGMACQYNSGELVSMDKLQPFIQDALDLIEFANGPADGVWGKKRAEMGHPAPFNLKFLGVGNEQWGPQYIERYAPFAKAIKEKYPNVKLVSSAGPGPSDDKFKFAWSKLRELNADIIDEHCYAAPSWFYDSATRYDNYDRNGPKVFMGEYASQSKGMGRGDNINTFECALSEAAFMTGLERNADVVVMASYAPLFAHIDAWQWTPDLIWCDNLTSYGTPSYYVQQLFSRNRGDVVLPVKLNAPTNDKKKPTLFATACRDEKSGDVILKVVNSSDKIAETKLSLAGAGKLAAKATVLTLTSEKLTDANSFAEPKKVSPVESSFEGVAPEFVYSFKPHSVTVLRLSVEK